MYIIVQNCNLFVIFQHMLHFEYRIIIKNGKKLAKNKVNLHSTHYSGPLPKPEARLLKKNQSHQFFVAVTSLKFILPLLKTLFAHSAVCGWSGARLPVGSSFNSCLIGPQ